MAKYTEIINEIEEQITGIISHRDAASASIQEKTEEIAQLQEQIVEYTSQLEGLEGLKANTQSLIDVDKNREIDINLNLNVASTGGSVFNSSTQI